MPLLLFKTKLVKHTVSLALSSVKTTFFFFLFIATGLAQYPWQSALVSQWIDTNDLGGVTLGYYAGSGTPTNTDAIRLGFFAAASPAAVLTSGIAIGRHSGYEANGQQSVFIGHAAGQYAGKGGDAGGSVAIGYLAARNALNFSPHYSFGSVHIGNNAGTQTKSAQASVVIGGTAAQTVASTVGATIIGYGAGFGATNLNGSVLIGQYAGANSGNSLQCIFIGSNAGQNLTGNYQLVIDSNPAYSTGTTGLIYGNCWDRTLRLNANTIGFFGGTPVVKPTVTGSVSGGTATQSLINALQSLNLINNQTTP